ncbi:MAG: hypothetical protein M2R45_01350 [Verrucomicrobia subdivision 3 bacterium]|nr:hypothetical protein [Limisphaerales bacterium]MCS1416031.1 hypothetical protein [Limisphaerales bacterium]
MALSVKIFRAELLLDPIIMTDLIRYAMQVHFQTLTLRTCGICFTQALHRSDTQKSRF